MKTTLSLFVLTMMLGTGCATVQNGGFADPSRYGEPGPVLDTITLGKGLLVADVTLDQGRQVQAQISNATLEDYQDPTLFEQILTIGHFSKVVGSGFAKKENVFYRKRIWNDGKDVFQLDGETYMVEWTLNYRNPVTHLVADMFTLHFRHIQPTADQNTP